jgi:hypothetical protein
VIPRPLADYFEVGRRQKQNENILIYFLMNFS